MFTTMLLILGLALCLGMAASPQLRDGLLKLSRALPASTLTVTSPAIDTGVSSRGGQLESHMDLLLTAPAVTTAQLPDAKIFAYTIIHSDNADLSSPVNLYPNLITQTGAGGVGAALATQRLRLPSDAKRYIGFTIAPSAVGTGDASGATATLEALF